MATLQKRISRGHAYWSIVESRRINGKPRPIILEYLGSAENLLERLQEGIPKKVRSYAHGAVAPLLAIADQMQVVKIINKYVPSEQLRDGLSVGASLLLASLGRICRPTSKRNWYAGWAKDTSLGYLTGRSFRKLDSQHFWDQMQALPETAIAEIEETLLQVVIEKERIVLDTILLDMSNFFTYIASTNKRCTLAQRGKNKQRRIDLRQLGLLLVVSRQERLPLFHQIYQGNLVDRTIFKEQFSNILSRFKALGGSEEAITLVFDQGNNSKDMLRNVQNELYFVGALSALQHKELIIVANQSLACISVKGRDISCYRVRKTIWRLDLTAVVYISEKLRQGQIRGYEQNIHKLSIRLNLLKSKLRKPPGRGPKRTQEQIEQRIRSLVRRFLPGKLVGWRLDDLGNHTFDLHYWIDRDYYCFLKEQILGRRILITNRHLWSTEEIILAYWGQSKVESVFRMIKNPFYLPVRPQYHWTDQKIRVHGLICFIALLLATILQKRARELAGFDRSFFTLMELLTKIRLATFIEKRPGQKKGRYKTTYVLEEMDAKEAKLADGLAISAARPRLKTLLSVYK